MRDKLTKLLQEYSDNNNGVGSNHGRADYLLENGVIVPPCKVGDTVWYELYGQIESAVIYHCIGNLTRDGFIITEVNAKNGDGLEIAFNGKGLGKAIFLTKEEAEQALKGGAE